MPRVAHIGVKIVFSPECAVLPENFIRFTGGVAFQFLDDLGQRCLADFDEPMDVVGHDNPREPVMPLPVMEPEGVFSQPGDVRPTQTTFAATTDEVGFQLPPAVKVLFNFVQRLPFGTERCRK